MRLDLFPLEAEPDELVLARLAEECSEVQKEAMKILRFGLGAHPLAPAGTNNLRALLSEMEDVRLCMAEVDRRWNGDIANRSSRQVDEN